MLSGIKIGKKKKKAPSESKQQQIADSVSKAVPNSIVSSTDKSNQSIADQLRQCLATGQKISSSTSRQTESNNGDILEKRGRIHRSSSPTQFNEESTNSIIVLTNDYRTAYKPSTSKDEYSMTVKDMVAEELAARHVSQSELDARDVIRWGKKRKLKDPTDSDDDEQQKMQPYINDSRKTKNDDNKQKSRDRDRDRARQISQYIHSTKIVSKCWWWIDSGPTAFQQHRLISIGDYVTLVMVPKKLALIPGEHFYLVPIPYCEALSGCDDQVWKEILLFQNSLQELYKKEGKVVLYTEIVLPNKSVWQTKIECFAVPSKIGYDAELYFRSALMELVQEWGTHQRLMRTSNSTDPRDLEDAKPAQSLRRTIPKGFPYIHMQYDSSGGTGNYVTRNEGYVLIIEQKSKDFPKNFAYETIGGMIKMDRMSLRMIQNKKDNDSNKHSSKSSIDEEKQLVSHFVAKWKPFDWTEHLD
jgi:Protein similar to CwfJ C-terminus 1/Protein similar to CwfJ C-terminus 2